jgi:hypothetical protein
MKFRILDSHRGDERVAHDDKPYSDKYQYLDDLLDKTFIVDYFMDHAATLE